MRKESDFYIDLDGVGRFWFARRTFRLATNIMVERARLLNGASLNEVDDETAGMVNVISTLQVLCTEAPAGWGNFAEIDMLDQPDAFARMFDLYVKLTEKEDSFRGAAKSRSPQKGQRNSEDDAVLVSEKVQPAA